MRNRIKNAFAIVVLILLTSSLGACCWGWPICGVPGGGPGGPGPGGPGPSGLR